MDQCIGKVKLTTVNQLHPFGRYPADQYLAFKSDLANIGEIVSLKKLHPKVEFK